jgi:hypothetical protein
VSVRTDTNTQRPRARVRGRFPSTEASMSRFLLVSAAIVAIALPARADRIAPIAQPIERALRSPVVVVGKVTAVEKDAVETTLYPGASNKVAHKIAAVKVETNLAGADNTTHLKVGFVPPGAGGRRGPENPELKEGQEWLFFVTKHHSGEFYAIPYMTPPLDAKAPGFKGQVEAVKKVLATVADPAKALKTEKAEDRFAASVAIIYKLRTPPEGSFKGTEAVTLTADESRPILKALAESAWKDDPGFTTISGYRSFVMLGLTEADGWKAPAAEAGKDYVELTRAAYTKWLDGPGKDYRIKKLVPKKAEK